MCGVTGLFHYAEPQRTAPRDVVQAMADRLKHRGPDAEGFYVDGPLALGHRRLSIVDLTPTGAQPMTSPNGQAVISYNGEFYNHLEFRPRLEAKGYRFRGTSDTETLLYLLTEYGPDALRDISGIFAFAYWNRAHRTLVLARDHLGVKQLYFHDDGKRIAFASEIKALMVCPGVEPGLDGVGLNDYLHFHTPLFERTLFKDIHQLRAGEHLTLSMNAKRAKRYWTFSAAEKNELPAEHQVEELAGLLEKVVSDQLLSDVPVGAFFSGGIDSSAIAAYAQRCGRPLRCFGIHFNEPGSIDEGPYQRQAAESLGLPLDLITLPNVDLAEDLPKLLYQQDQPVIGAAVLPMYYVSQLAAKHVKVCLGGQAADELFGGYARYALAYPLRFGLSTLMARKGKSQGPNVATSAPAKVGGNLSKQLTGKNWGRLAKLASDGLDWQERYFDHFCRIPEKTLEALFPDVAGVSRQQARMSFLDVVSSAPGDRVDRLMTWDVKTYLPGLFQQDDRMSMAHSLESRVPFADPRMVRFAFRVRSNLKIKSGASKWILRKTVESVLPDFVLNRQKAGFDTPAEPWFRGPAKEFVRETLLGTKARQRGYWNNQAVAKALEDDASPHWFPLIWKLVCIEQWAQAFKHA